jgi:hypothetical protein
MNNTTRVFQPAFIGALGILLMASCAGASTITYTTNAAGTEFVAGNIGINGDTLNSSSGVVATLVFTPNASSDSGFPSNINYGSFLLTCVTCSVSQDTFFSAFTFDLVISDTTDGGTGEFVGSSSGGTVSSNSSTIDISWVPLQLGPGTENALTNSFGPTIFGNTGMTPIVAPNSGTPQGVTTVQGTINSAPESSTLLSFGGGLIALGAIGRKRIFLT